MAKQMIIEIKTMNASYKELKRQKTQGIKTWRSVKIFITMITLGISRPLKTLITTNNF